MRTTARIQARVSPAQAAGVLDYARRNSLTASAALRVLVDRALAEDSVSDRLALAALVAAEHSLLVMSSVFPDGDRRRREQAEAAVEAAERRLAALTDRLSAEAGSNA